MSGRHQPHLQQLPIRDGPPASPGRCCSLHSRLSSHSRLAPDDTEARRRAPKEGLEEALPRELRFLKFQIQGRTRLPRGVWVEPEGVWGESACRVDQWNVPGGKDREEFREVVSHEDG